VIDGCRLLIADSSRIDLSTLDVLAVFNRQSSINPQFSINHRSAISDHQ